jgi:ribosomal protein S18 acetylase RimI-like enzyme
MTQPAPVKFYCCNDPSTLPDGNALRVAAGDVIVRHWQAGQPKGPAGFSMGKAAAIYTGFHRLRIFRNRNYGALCIDTADGELIHVSSIFPSYFRFPFMQQNDLQIGATYTHPKARGRKLAQLALVEAARHLMKPGRTIWYLTEAANTASVKAVEAAGFSYVGEGAKMPRLGIRAIGAYQLTRSSSEPQ